MKIVRENVEVTSNTVKTGAYVVILLWKHGSAYMNDIVTQILSIGIENLLWKSGNACMHEKYTKILDICVKNWMWNRENSYINESLL